MTGLTTIQNILLGVCLGELVCFIEAAAQVASGKRDDTGLHKWFASMSLALVVGLVAYWSKLP